MSRLIDADALLNECADCQKTDPNFEKRGWANHFISMAGEPSTEWYCVEDMIENAPTIAAIPVEWLEEQRRNSVDVQWHYAVAIVLAKWHKEQEAKA